MRFADCALQFRLHPRHQFAERGEYCNAGRLQCRALGFKTAMTAVHQRTGVPHRHAFGRTAAGDQGKHRLVEFLRNQGLRKILFFVTADFADNKQPSGAFVLFPIGIPPRSLNQSVQ